MNKTSAAAVAATHISDSIRVKQTLLDQTAELAEISSRLCDVIRGGGRILCCGNGGSACDAMHFSEELVARYLRERPAIPAQHLGDSSTITCWANDYDYDGVFERQVAAFGTTKDALLVFTTSGNSPNILRAIETANSIGMLSVALLGKGGGKAKDLSSLALVVQSETTSRIQEAHSAIIHILCELIETELYPEAAS
jgi:D-sedoheptulose 7-phosphate isomerase